MSLQLVAHLQTTQANAKAKFCKRATNPTHGRQKRSSKLKDKMKGKINTERLTRGKHKKKTTL